MEPVPLIINPIFSALTRPAMFMGITLDYFLFSATIVVSFFILFNSAMYCLVYIPLHIIGVLGCKYDVHYFSIIAKLAQFPAVKNKKYWKCQSYEPM